MYLQTGSYMIKYSFMSNFRLNMAFCADIECLDMTADLGSVKNNRMLDESV